MDLFDAPRKMRKVPSPIKHLLREDAKEDDPLPKPTWGAPNAPPIVGAVHRRPREANVSFHNTVNLKLSAIADKKQGITTT
jgi:chromatin structure-remodeling complex subunit RSC1/2